ncbi:MAG: DUF3857 domain-containing protein [Planctomycetaceae bacterium]|nr:DUF3857 domain-containing protein [Planctomycetaceae bacterium]
MARFSTLARFTAIAVALLPSGHALADECRWGDTPLSLSAEQLVEQADSVPLIGTHDVEYLLEESVIQIEADGRTIQTLRSIYRILTDVGVEEYSTVESEWSPWHQNRPLMKARVINSKDDEVWLTEREVFEGPVQHEDNVFSDRRRLIAPLPAVRKGSLVETMQRIEDTQCSFEAGTARYHLFNRIIPCHQVRLVLDLDNSLPFHQKQHGRGLKFRRSSIGQRTILSWETSVPLGLEEFEFPAPSDSLQGTQVAYSTARSWSDVVGCYSKLIESKLTAPELQQQVEEIIGEETGQEAKVRKLTQFIQQRVRYTGLVFGDGTIVPTHPTETLRRRYGDCKDQSALLIAMLHCAGIEAHPVLIRSSLGRDVTPGLPGLGLFNHMIVQVDSKLNMLVDPVAVDVDFGELPVTDQNRLCLIIRDGESELTRSPVSRPETNSINRVREFTIVSESDVRLVETTTYRGAKATELRQMVLVNGERDFTNLVRDRATDRLRARVLDVQLSSVNDQPNLPQIVIATSATEFLRRDENVYSLLLDPTSVLMGLPDEMLDTRPCMTEAEHDEYRLDCDTDRSRQLLEVRQLPRSLNFPIHTPQLIQLTNRIHWPAGIESLQLPKPTHVAIGRGYYSAVFRVESDQTLVAEFTLSTGNRDLTPLELRQWQQHFASLGLTGDAPQWHVVVQATNSDELDIERGRFVEGFQQLRRNLNQQPRNPIHRMRLAEAYAEAGFTEIARQMAAQTVQQFPNHVEAHLSAATVIRKCASESHPLSLSDREQVIFHMRQAVRLDPRNPEHRVTLALLLYVNPKGMLSDRNTLLECVRLLRSVEGVLLENGHGLVMECLYFAGEYEQVCRYHDQHPLDGRFVYYKAASIAALQGANQALALIRSEVPVADQIDMTAQVLLYLRMSRQYDEAVEFLQSLERSPLNHGESMGDIIAAVRQFQRYQTVLEPANEPIGIVQRLIINILVDQEKCGPNAELLHHADQRLAAIAKQSIPLIDSARRPHQVRATGHTADLISTLRFTRTGSLESGYCVSTAHGQLKFLLARIDGRLKVLASVKQTQELGEDALQLLSHGQLAEARACINGAFETLQDSAGATVPYAGEPLTKIWGVGDVQNADAERVRYAAVTLALPQKTSDGLTILLSMRPRVPVEEQVQIDRTIVKWARQHHQWKDAIAAAERLTATEDGHTVYGQALAELLIADKQYGAAREWIAKERQAMPDSITLLRLLAKLAAAEGNVAEALSVYQQICRSRDAISLDYCDAVWTAVSGGTIDAAAISNAKAAADLDFFDNSDGQQVLAFVYAETGRINEALNLLRRCEQMQTKKPSRGDLDYVRGRIAEMMGMTDVANYYYDRVLAAEKDPAKGTPAYLARQRRGKIRTVSQPGALVNPRR